MRYPARAPPVARLEAVGAAGTIALSVIATLHAGAELLRDAHVPPGQECGRRGSGPLTHDRAGCYCTAVLRIRKGSHNIDTRDVTRAYTVEAAAEAFLIDRRWPDGIVCPHCGHDDIHIRDSPKPTPYRCRGKGCRRFFSVRTGTMLQSSNLPLTTWVLAFHLCSTGPRRRVICRTARAPSGNAQVGMAPRAPDQGGMGRDRGPG